MDILADIKQGNGNRRILCAPGELTAPWCMRSTTIVASYEKELAALRKAEETNRQLMTSLSHDVRTPLTTLIGYLDAVHKGNCHRPGEGGIHRDRPPQGLRPEGLHRRPV